MIIIRKTSTARHRAPPRFDKQTGPSDDVFAIGNRKLYLFIYIAVLQPRRSKYAEKLVQSNKNTKLRPLIMTGGLWPAVGRI